MVPVEVKGLVMFTVVANGDASAWNESVSWNWDLYTLIPVSVPLGFVKAKLSVVVPVEDIVIVDAPG